ncbi:MAG: hypothetical protein IE933_01820 [Sphingomonadales bacterium]|nr:hypothetical protein [Sphingomonadales bacterium]MBD3773365.1 hypothetical protein [Paracoccaceae bacterium]
MSTKLHVPARLLAAPFFASLAFYSAPALAASLTQPWQFISVEGDCSLMAKYSDGTGMFVTAKRIGTQDVVTMRMVNAAWPRVEGQQAGGLTLSSGEKLTPAVSTGTRTGSDILYASAYLRDSGIIEKLSASSSMNIYIAGGQRGPFPLANFASQVPALQRCVGWPVTGAAGSSAQATRPAPTTAPPPVQSPAPVAGAVAGNSIAQPRGEWELKRNSSGQCDVTVSYDDGTVISIFARRSDEPGKNFLFFFAANARWRGASPETEFNGSMAFSNNVSRDALAGLKGTVDLGSGTSWGSYKFGYIDEKSDVAALFSSQSWMQLREGSAAIGKYSLKGSSAAMTKLRGCAGFGTQTTAQVETTTQKSKLAKQKLIEIFDHIILADSRTWMFNRYDPGSVYDFQITQYDARGDPATIRVFYTYNRGMKGYVDVSMLHGEPSCMRFHDNGFVCKPVY